MSTPERPLPAATPTREELAHIEVGHTTVSPPVRRAIFACFLFATAIVPIVELAAAAGGGTTGVTGAWSHLAELPRAIGRQLAGDKAGAGARGVWTDVVSANRHVLAGLNAFERALDDQSLLGRLLRQPAQALMTGLLGAGNERVYPGHDGWLFYRPDVEYLTGPAFLAPAQLRRRVAGADEWQEPPRPDPREAIIRFRDDLRELGIALIVMPTPVKPGVHPERLARHGTDGEQGVLQNASYEAFVSDLERAGVLVFDPAGTLATPRGAAPQYLLTDTHWRPEAMEAVAGNLARFIAARVELPDVPAPDYRVEQVEVQNIGDTARMLDLPETAALYPPESAWLRRVLQGDGALWRSSREADVLLLGDSFSNIYALDSMGWGTSAGFAEQLSLSLRRPLDRIVQNDEGAFATRALLQQDPSRLATKRVVVYQFAARELAFGDWKILPISAAAANGATR